VIEFATIINNNIIAFEYFNHNLQKETIFRLTLFEKKLLFSSTSTKNIPLPPSKAGLLSSVVFQVPLHGRGI
jgi:hypothetical protein